MATPKWATAHDVQEAWIGEPMTVPTATIEKWICRAERRLAREVPNLQQRIDADTEPDLQDTVIDVVTSMVERKLRNPEGMRSRTSVTGPFTDTETIGGDNPGQIWVTPEELAALAPPDTRGKAFSIDPWDPDLVGRPDPWAPKPLPPGVSPLTGVVINAGDTPRGRS